QRADALQLLRDLGGRRQPGGSTELVGAFLLDGEVKAAWQAAAEGGCTEQVWLRLADLRRADHPDDALAVYRRARDDVLQTTGDASYARAVKLLTTMRDVFVAAGREEEFIAEARAVREANR